VVKTSSNVTEATVRQRRGFVMERTTVKTGLMNEIAVSDRLLLFM